MMDKQDVFDLMVKKFVEEEKFGYDEAQNMCLYRTPEGNRCAIGLILQRMGVPEDDETWDTAVAFSFFPTRLYERVEDFTGLPGVMLSNLQSWHDRFSTGFMDKRLAVKELREILGMDR